MRLQQLKSLFLKTLIGCLVAAAGLAVVTILAGQFNDLSGKALVTILIIAIHALVSFGFIVNNEKQETFENLNFFTNVTFLILVLSFITAVFGVWGLVSGALVAKLYALYFVLLFATLHGEVLVKILGKQLGIDKVVYSNLGFMAAVVIMLIPVIFIADSVTLDPFYYRLLAAVGIVDATLTLVAVILHKLYVQKHPTVTDPVFNLVRTPDGQLVQAAVPKKRGMNIFVVLLIGYVCLQIVGSIIVGVLGALN
jgi:hypothetical protein